MPLENRVLPTGEIVSHAARGTMMGNRGGVLHTPDRQLGRKRWRSRRWICCVLSFKGRRRQVMAPGHYTELFFLDEATALAAGHRPCAECRRAAYRAFHAALRQAGQPFARADDLDAVLHRDRIPPPGGIRRTWARPADLPTGAMILVDGAAHLVSGMGLQRFSLSGYGPPLPFPGQAAPVLTAPTMLAALHGGYRPVLHPSACA